MAARPLTDRRIRLLRQAGQLLHRPRGRSVDDIVRHLVGLQAQDRVAFPLAVRARSARLTASDVEAALLEERSVVRTWAMRGTLHLVAAEDYGWLVPLAGEPVIPGVYTRLGQLGVPRDDADRGVRLIERMLAEGPMTRAEIAERLARRGIESGGQAKVHLLLLATLRGTVCDGPPRGSKITHVLSRDWLGPWRQRSKARALAELASRYLAAHGPATPKDFATWSGLRAAEVKAGWGSLDLREVGTARGPMWTLRGRRAEPPTGVVRFLPLWDTYLLGWKGRELMAPEEEQRTAIFPGGGMLFPTVVRDGLAVARWSWKRSGDGWAATLHPFAGQRPVPRSRLRAEVEDMGRFLGTQVELRT